jgi:hypothetical protein
MLRLPGQARTESDGDQPNAMANGSHKKNNLTIWLVDENK